MLIKSYMLQWNTIYLHCWPIAWIPETGKFTFKSFSIFFKKWKVCPNMLFY